MKTEPSTLTCSFNNGIEKGDKIRIFDSGIKKPWYKRLFHFLTFRKFDYYIVTEVKDDSTLTFK